MLNLSAKITNCGRLDDLKNQYNNSFVKQREGQRKVYIVPRTRWRADESMEEIDEKQMDKFLTCLAEDQIVDDGAAVNTETPHTNVHFCEMTRIPLVLYLTQTDV